MTTPDPTRSKAIEVMARAVSIDLGEDPDALDVLIYGRPGKRPHWEGYESAAAAALTAYESHLQAEGMAVVPVAHLEPFAKYYRSRMAVQMRGLDDCIHRIHPGGEHEAEISVTDCGRLNDAMPPASPYGKAKEESK